MERKKHPPIAENAAILAEWDFDKNTGLDPQKISLGSQAKAWWKCSRGHEWFARVGSRLVSGCPECTGKGKLQDKNVLWARLDVQRYFDFSSNPEIDPRKISRSSDRKIACRCPECASQWLQKASSVIRCKECSRQELARSRSLSVLFPEVARQWDQQKNGGVSAAEVPANTKKKGWWLCPEGHSFLASISQRTLHKTGCNMCLGRGVIEGASLFDLHPKLMDEWDYAKNEIDPRKIPARSNKNVWWKCEKGHEWQRAVNYRASKDTGCPYCRALLATPDNNLRITHSNLIQEWDYVRNSEDPRDFTFRNRKKVFWKCVKGHTWQAAIADRCNGTRCPFCAGKVASPESNLKTDFPEVAAEWDAEKNQGATPEQVRPKSSKRAWWLCPRGHSYEASIASRTYMGSGCPVCQPSTSKVEIRAFTELRSVYPDTLWREKVLGKEIDVFIPSVMIGIEVDGFYWHQEKQESDSLKTSFFAENGIRIFRLRDVSLPKINGDVYEFDSSSLSVTDWFRFCDWLARCLDRDGISSTKLADYVSSGELLGEELYGDIVRRLPAPPREKSLIVTHPDLAREWHEAKNSPLTPDLFSAGSGEKVWWVCKSRHSWTAAISSRVAGTGCPYCSRRKVDASNSLASLMPQLAAQWHPSKNGDLTPDDVVAGGHKKPWWRCDEGHEWSATIASRISGSGCPYCASRLLSPENTLASRYPQLVPEWHERNDKRPTEVSKGSDYYAWWRCSSCGHEWQAKVYARMHGRGCIKCSYPRRRKAA